MRWPMPLTARFRKLLEGTLSPGGHSLPESVPYGRLAYVIGSVFASLALWSGCAKADHARGAPEASPPPPAPADISPDAEQRIARHLAALQSNLDPRAAATLDRIDGLGRRLLAARAYVRSGANLAQRWSWSAEEIASYEGSPLQRRLDEEIGRIRAAFEKQNPGYTLWVNPQVRSLEIQLERWNANESVAAAGILLLADLRAAAVPLVETSAWLEEFLRAYVPTPALPLAAPGLSAHGRMSAVDFQVRAGERTVAAPSLADVPTIWNAQGWRERLQAAVEAGSRHFEGPLQVPDEPWHYDYRPASAAVAVADSVTAHGGSSAGRR